MAMKKCWFNGRATIPTNGSSAHFWTPPRGEEPFSDSNLKIRSAASHRINITYHYRIFVPSNMKSYHKALLIQKIEISQIFTLTHAIKLQGSQYCWYSNRELWHGQIRVQQLSRFAKHNNATSVFGFLHITESPRACSITQHSTFISRIEIQRAPNFSLLFFFVFASHAVQHTTSHTSSTSHHNIPH